MSAEPAKATATPSRHFLNELRASFASHARRPAIQYKDQLLTYSDLALRARRCAARLRDVGITPGDRVAIVTGNKLPFLTAHLGALFAGAVSLPLNPRLTRDELRYYLNDSEAHVVVADDEPRVLINAMRAELPALGGLLSDTEAWNAPDSHFADPEVSADAGCFMLYSSGTTGRPKGVLHTNADVASSLHALAECWRFTADDVLVNVLPLFHIHGLSFATHLCLLVGASMLMDDMFHPRRTLDLIDYGTVFMAVPTFYYSFLERPEFKTAAQAWRNMRLFTCGSAPIRPEILPELEETLGRPVINRYGMTEGHVITSLPLGGPWPQGSVGPALAGVELTIVGENGGPVPAGDVGSVHLRGPNLFREYWRNPTATQAAFTSGSFDTGDLGRRDANGFLTLVGRKNDLIITNGFNVYPQVVERVINDCPGVRESAVLGLPDKRRGERIAAAVVRSDDSLTERTLKDYLGEHLVDYQRPVEIAFVTELPRNAMGKILRRALRDGWPER